MRADELRSPRYIRTASLMLAALTVGACRGGERRSMLVSVDTLESGVVLVHSEAVGLWGPGEAWTAVEETRIGSANAADPNVLFADIWDVTLDGLGRIYVLDRQPNEVRVFSPSGAYVCTLGREGGGPGEFRNPIGLAWGPEGNLWVVDVGNGRYSVFDSAGRYLDSYPRRIGAWGYPWGGGFDDAGRLYEPSLVRDAVAGEARSVYIAHDVSEGLVAADTFDLPDYDASSWSYTFQIQGGATTVQIPFAPRLRWRFDGSGGIWFGVSDAYRLYHRTLDGDTTLIVEREYEPIPMEEADREAVRERFPELGEQQANAIVARMPEVKPAFETFVVDDLGYLWVKQTSASQEDRPYREAPFDVLDPEGRYLGAVRVDVGVYPPPRIIGNRLVGVVTDEFDTPYVVVHRIEGR
jgi:hypothetical protein